MTSFAEFGLSKPILTALVREGHTTPTPIQQAAIPVVLKGRDLLGIAQTGTGKTAAFALPILTHLSKDRQRPAPRECRVLVLAPTRELALQVKERFDAYGAAQGLATGLVIGGVAFGKQRAMLHRGLDILVATPGRLIDVIEKGALKLDAVDHFVLDEVDQMLDLGFIHSIRKIASMLPAERQNIFFSATMPPAIAKLASALLDNPARVEVAAAKPLKIDESVIFVEKPNKAATLIKIVKEDGFARGIVFTRTKHGADKLVRALGAAGVSSHPIHGNRSQGQREKALNAFRKGKANILVATDIAARGIDIQDVSHVVNYDLPNVPETYTHRIGRTGRAGAAGVAISFCSGEERPFLRAIERMTGNRLTAANDEGVSDIRENRADERRNHGNRSGKKWNSEKAGGEKRHGDRKPRGPRPESRQDSESNDGQRQNGYRKDGERKFDGHKAGGRKNGDRKFEASKDRNNNFDRNGNAAQEYKRRDDNEYKRRSLIDDALDAEDNKNRSRKFEGRKGAARNGDAFKPDEQRKGGRKSGERKYDGRGGDERKSPHENRQRRKGGPKTQQPSRPAAFHSNDVLAQERTDDQKGQQNDQGRTDRVRRRRHRGAAGRQLSRHAG